MRKLVVLVMLAVITAALPARATNDELPNLVPYPATEIRIALDDGRTGQALRFSTITANLGDHHFEMVGGAPESATSTRALQCVQWERRVCLERRDVGTMTFHRMHAHWHLDDYARYELRRLLPDGTPDMTDAGLVVDGGKISFCLLDTDRTNKAEPFPQDPFGWTGFYLGCLGAIQGISSGWADQYYYGLAGQQLLLDGVNDGRYAIVITIDPDDRLLETTSADNVSWRAIELSKNATEVKPL